MNKIFFLLTSVFLTSTLACMAEDKVNETNKVVISKHVEYAKISLEQKCHQLKKKLKKLENQLCLLEQDSSNEMDQEKRRERIRKQIKKCEDKINVLTSTQSSLETINLNAI